MGGGGMGEVRGDARSWRCCGDVGRERRVERMR